MVAINKVHQLLVQAMPIALKCYANCDDVLLAWEVVGHPQQTIPACIGFAIEARKSDGSIEVLHNLKGFAADQPAEGETQETTQWPLQTYMWTDHTAVRSTAAQFRVTAMLGVPGQLTRGESSDWSDTVTLDAQADGGIAAYFNRGVILSQFVSRYAKDNNITTMAALKTSLGANVNAPLMQFLAGELGRAIRGILAEARSNAKIELYCALFELDLDDVIEGLCALGSRAHVILGNGAVKSAGDDENAAAAKRLLDAGVDLTRRNVAPAGLAHNKTVVVVMDGTPLGVWTGSTNWTMTGFHTQLNNGLAITHAAIAQAYLDQWKALQAAGSTFTAELKTRNATVKGPFTLSNGGEARVWFTPNAAAAKSKPGGPDIDDLVSIVKSAKDGILFVMFMPGQQPLDTILQRQTEGLYVRGVVSSLPMGTRQNPSPTFTLMNSAGYKKYSLDVIQPRGVGAVGSFLSEFTRQEFLQGMGFAITHAKVIVVDPFGAHPVVVTGSHNFSASASGKNDENLLIIENCPALAKAYAVNCMSIYKHYRWPASRSDAQAPGAQPAVAASGFLHTTDAWQAKALSDATRADLNFWAS